MISRDHLLENNFSTISINRSQISFQLNTKAPITPISDLISFKFIQIKKIIVQITHWMINV